MFLICATCCYAKGDNMLPTKYIYTFDVEYIYRFVSLGGLQANSMTSQRGTLQDGR